jgi:phosphoglucomutase
LRLRGTRRDTDWLRSLTGGTLVIGGDGRYFNATAVQTIIKIAVAHGVKR